jgi:hypothetical protein
MKKIIIFILLFCGIKILYAQITIKTNELAAVGSKLLMAHDTNYYKITLNKTGEQNWDFSFLKNISSDTFYIINPSVSPITDSFPSSNYCLKINGADGTSFYQNLHIGDSLCFLGEYLKTSDMTAFSKRTPPEIFTLMPITYEPQQKITYKGLKEDWVNSSSNKQYFHKIIIDTTVTDGWGTLNLPNFSNINTIRLHKKQIKITKAYIINTNGDSNLVAQDTSITDSYLWFTNDKHIAFLALQIDVSKDTDIQFINSTHIITAINKLNNNRETIKIFPNPATNYFKISSIPKSCTNIKIYNAQGQFIKTIPKQKAQKNITIGNLNSGIYIIKFIGTKFAKKIIIK